LTDHAVHSFFAEPGIPHIDGDNRSDMGCGGGLLVLRMRANLTLKHESKRLYVRYDFARR
jgi:hypothetical protein